MEHVGRCSTGAGVSTSGQIDITRSTNLELEIRQIVSAVLDRHRRRLIALSTWLLCTGGFWWYVYQNEVTLTTLIGRLAAQLSHSRYSLVLYTGVFVARPLLFIPANVMFVVSGFLFGPVFGFLCAFVGNVISHSVSYLIGRYLGQDFLRSAEERASMRQYASWLRPSSFVSILIVRFLFLPQDLVSYASGILKIRWLAYAAATAISALPGITVYSQFGASLQHPADNRLSIPDPPYLLAPAVLALISLSFTWYMRQRS